MGRPAKNDEIRKKDFINVMAKLSGVSKYQCEIGYNIVIATLMYELSLGNSVLWYDFGKFNIIKKPSREIKMAGSDLKVRYPEHNAVKFIPNYNMKLRIKHKNPHLKNRKGPKWGVLVAPDPVENDEDI